MKAEDNRLTESINMWEFDSELKDDSRIECPDCKEVSSLSEWHEREVGCDLCGEHAAIMCPKCSELFDHIEGATFHIVTS